MILTSTVGLDGFVPPPLFLSITGGWSCCFSLQVEFRSLWYFHGQQESMMLFVMSHRVLSLEEGYR